MGAVGNNDFDFVQSNRDVAQRFINMLAKNILEKEQHLLCLAYNPFNQFLQEHSFPFLLTTIIGKSFIINYIAKEGVNVCPIALFIIGLRPEYECQSGHRSSKAHHTTSI